MLKKYIKQIVPMPLRNAYKLYNENLWIAKNRPIDARTERISEEREINLIKMVFIVQRTEVFASVKSVFDAAIKSGCEVYLLPLPRCANDKYELLWDTYEEVHSFCVGLGKGVVIDTYDKERDIFFDLKSILPTYVFLNVPYTNEYPEPYRIDKMSRYTKVCYIPYAYSMLEKNFKFSYSLNNLSKMSYIFAANKLGYKYCLHRVLLKDLLQRKKTVYNVGFPRFDLIFSDSDKNERTTILWLPRWTVSTGFQSDNEQSSFLLFYKDFLKFAEQRKDVDFIIRPHPHMFENFLKKGVMTEEEKDEFDNAVLKLDNVTLDNSSDYMKSLSAADILLADYSSIVIEFFSLGNPIVYYGSRDAFSKYDRPVFDTFYSIANWDEAKTRICDLLSGIDSKGEDRHKIKDHFIKCQNGQIGEKIIEILISNSKI